MELGRNRLGQKGCRLFVLELVGEVEADMAIRTETAMAAEVVGAGL